MFIHGFTGSPEVYLGTRIRGMRVCTQPRNSKLGGFGRETRQPPIPRHLDSRGIFDAVLLNRESTVQRESSRAP